IERSGFCKLPPFAAVYPARSLTAKTGSLGSANDFSELSQLKLCPFAGSPTFLQWTVLHTVPINLNPGNPQDARVSNCVVGSGGSWLPCSTIAEHSVEGCDHFSHDGDDDDLGFFVGGGEALVEGFEGGTVTACTEGGHVKDVTDRHPTTVDAAVSLELAAVEVIWCEADEGGDLFAAHLPEFWQQGDEREGQHGADAWHRGQQLIALSESHIGGNHLGQALVEEANIGLQSRLATFAEPPEHGIFEMSRLVL